ncbi:hypothetical protein BH18ACT8_BH18ACT8_06390 [soil metagenome]
MIFTAATMPCSDTMRPRMPEGAPYEYGVERGQAPESTTARGTSLPSSAFGAAGRGIDVSGTAPSFETKQAHVVGSRAWSPPV